jgi:hypothetical protein
MYKIAIDPSLLNSIRIALNNIRDNWKAAEPLVPYGLGAGAAGIATGIAYEQEEDAPGKELNKVKKALMLQELQSPTGHPEDMKKLSKEMRLLKTAAGVNWYTPVGTSILAGGIVGVPSYLAYDWAKERNKGKEVDEQTAIIEELKKKYDESFKGSIQQQLKVDPVAMETMVAEMGKSSAALPQSWDKIDKLMLGGMVAGGGGLSLLGFIQGKKMADDDSSRMQKIKMYRRSIEGLTKARPNAALIKLPMSAEEQVALEATRDTTNGKNHNGIKHTNEDIEAPKLSAKVNDPELQKLLQSI